MRFSGGDDYLKYYTVHFNLMEQYWYNQEIMIPVLLETVNRDITNLYQGLSMGVIGLSTIEFMYRVWWG